jgi:cellulose synthase/poly-beta-1,6-N-acetylglucosamine synthase-like glycosyltransferase
VRPLRTLAHLAQAGLLALGGYQALVALWGWRTPPPPPRGPRQRRFRVLVPARDEERVVAGLLGDLSRQRYPAGLVRVEVIADRCRDGTAAIARSFAGVVVAEREDGEPAKGPALAWRLRQAPLGPDEALVVLDADSRVPPDLLAQFDDALAAGALVVQAYVDVYNPDGSALSTASALSYWAGNRMVQLARRNLGWSADLCGTGMCLTPVALAAADGVGSSLAEDAELTAALALAGISVTWLHDLRVRDEKPESVEVAVGQRARWVGGKRAVARRYAVPLLARALRERSPADADLALRLVQPGRSFIALVTGLLAVVAAVTRSPLLIRWPALAGAAAGQALLPLPFLAREGVPTRYLVRYPLLTLIPLLWLPTRLLSRLRPQGWYPTPHGS